MERNFKVIYTNSLRVSIDDEEIVAMGLDPNTIRWKDLKLLIQRKIDSMYDCGSIVKIEEM